MYDIIAAIEASVHQQYVSRAPLFGVHLLPFDADEYGWMRNRNPLPRKAFRDSPLM